MSFDPGIWHVANETEVWELYHPLCGEKQVCNCSSKDYVEAIAAVPEMVELLRAAWLEMDNAVQTYIPVGEDGNDMAELCGKIEALLDRIDGEEGNE